MVTRVSFCEFGSGDDVVEARGAGVPPLAFVQLLNSDALQPDAVAHFRRLVRREGWSELELVRRDRQVPIRWFREVFADLDPESATRFGLAFAEQAQLTSFGPLSLPLISAASVARSSTSSAIYRSSQEAFGRTSTRVRQV